MKTLAIYDQPNHYSR